MKKLSGTILSLALFCCSVNNIPGAHAVENPSSAGPAKTVISRVSTIRSYGTTLKITSTNGTVIVADPYMMPKTARADIITGTHGHFDHWDNTFISRMITNSNVIISYAKVECFTNRGIVVTSIAASHDSSPVNADSPTDVLYVFEVDGLRIVHMGDIGQDNLSQAQLQALGHIDIALMQLVNSYSDMSMNNEKGFRLIDQFKPQIVIPTHTSTDATAKLGQIYGSYEQIQNSWGVSPFDLKDGKKKVIDLK